jgi:Rieske Fe-S protein
VCAAVIVTTVACGGATGPEPPAQPFAEVTQDEIVIRLAAVPSLSQPNSVVVIYEANVIVLHLARDDYRAFTNICTHAGCGIHVFAEHRFRCQCHGSEYDVEGRNVVGPATEPLRRYQLKLEPGMLRIDRRG